MREQRAGQATFLPLDTIKVKPVNEKYRTFGKGARLALDVIEVDPAVEAALQYACGNALVCDTAEIAKYVCYEKRQEVKGGGFLHSREIAIVTSSHSCLSGRNCHPQDWNDYWWSIRDWKLIPSMGRERS